MAMRRAARPRASIGRPPDPPHRRLAASPGQRLAPPAKACCARPFQARIRPAALTRLLRFPLGLGVGQSLRACPQRLYESPAGTLVETDRMSGGRLSARALRILSAAAFALAVLAAALVPLGGSFLPAAAAALALGAAVLFGASRRSRPALAPLVSLDAPAVVARPFARSAPDLVPFLAMDGTAVDAPKPRPRRAEPHLEPFGASPPLATPVFRFKPTPRLEPFAPLHAPSPFLSLEPGARSPRRAAPPSPLARATDEEALLAA